MDCKKPSVEEIKKWLRENFGPEWENKIEIGYKLWEKKHCKQYAAQIQSPQREYQKTSISSAKPRSLVEFEGIVLDRDFIKYMGCPICFKSVRNGCEHLNSGTEPVELRISKIVLSDGTGEVAVSTLLKPEDEDPFDGVVEGDVLKVRGYYIVKQGESRMYLNEAEIVKKFGNGKKNEPTQNNAMEDIGELDRKNENIVEKNINTKSSDIHPAVEKFLNYLGHVGGMKKDLVEMMLKNRGLRWEDIQNYVKYNRMDDKVYVREGALE